MKKNTKIAFNSIEQIEAIISKLGPNLNFSDISGLAVALHELKNFVNSVQENHEAQLQLKENTQLTRSKYQKYIVVDTKNEQFPMKSWVSKKSPFPEIADKISHEISRILVNKYNFKKVIDSENNVVLHYQPK
jgi:ATP-dependent Zn protease